MNPTLRIIDETEATRVVVVKQRAYTVPKDVADAHDELVAALTNARVLLCRYADRPTNIQDLTYVQLRRINDVLEMVSA